MKTLFDQIAKPIIQRIGTAVGSAVAAFGLSSAQVDGVEAAVVLLLGVAVDLATRKVF